MTRHYLAGPMTGYQDFNYPAFHAAAAILRSMGMHIENPAENPEPPCGSWGAYMRLAITQLLKCEAIILLPGWENSRGATLEVHIASMVGMTVYPLEYFWG